VAPADWRNMQIGGSGVSYTDSALEHPAPGRVARGVAAADKCNGQKRHWGWAPEFP
jgi:hypothetical protein